LGWEGHRLFLDERRVDFEQPGHACRPRVLHARVAPERVALVDQVEGSFAFERGSQIGVCVKCRPLACGRVAPGGRREPVQRNGLQAGGRVAPDA
jgi:hypothetical protein